MYLFVGPVSNMWHCLTVADRFWGQKAVLKAT